MERNMSNTKITLTNTFHSTECNLIVGEPDDQYGEYAISESQARRAIRVLCGITDCGCGGIGGWDPRYTAEYGGGGNLPSAVAVRETSNLRCSDYYQANGGVAEVLGQSAEARLRETAHAQG
jgi:hypothetical protein